MSFIHKHIFYTSTLLDSFQTPDCVPSTFSINFGLPGNYPHVMWKRICWMHTQAEIYRQKYITWYPISYNYLHISQQRNAKCQYMQSKQDLLPKLSSTQYSSLVHRAKYIHHCIESFVCSIHELIHFIHLHKFQHNQSNTQHGLIQQTNIQWNSCLKMLSINK